MVNLICFLLAVIICLLLIFVIRFVLAFISAMRYLEPAYAVINLFKCMEEYEKYKEEIVLQAGGSPYVARAEYGKYNINLLDKKSSYEQLLELVNEAFSNYEKIRNYNEKIDNMQEEIIEIAYKIRLEKLKIQEKGWGYYSQPWYIYENL